MAWPPGGHRDRDAGFHQALPQEAGGGDAILQVALQRQADCQALPNIRGTQRQGGVLSTQGRLCLPATSSRAAVAER